MPAVLRPSTAKRGRTYAEVEKILAKGDVKGKLTRDDLPTPALILDLDAFEFNVAKMASHCKNYGLALRPHGKSHKCPEIAKALIRAGAVGCCAAKLSEGEVFTGRMGIMPGEPALGLAQLISTMPNLKLSGIQAYAGHAAHVIGWDERRKVSQTAMARAIETSGLFQTHGIECSLLTGGSTGVYDIDSDIKGITELQPGSFIFMDVDYGRIGGKDGPVYQDFRNSLSVLTTVVSKPSDSLAIVDGGYKAFSTDKPFTPEAKGISGIGYSWGGDEHGKLDVAKASAPLNVGTRLEFIIPHCDPSVNLYDRIHCLRGDSVEAVWKIAARGMSQ